MAVMNVWVVTMSRPVGVTETGAMRMETQRVIILNSSEWLARRSANQMTKEGYLLYGYKVADMLRLEYPLDSGPVPVEIDWHADIFISQHQPMVHEE